MHEGLLNLLFHHPSQLILLLLPAVHEGLLNLLFYHPSQLILLLLPPVHEGLLNLLFNHSALLLCCSTALLLCCFAALLLLPSTPLNPPAPLPPPPTATAMLLCNRYRDPLSGCEGRVLTNLMRYLYDESLDKRKETWDASDWQQLNMRELNRHWCSWRDPAHEKYVTYPQQKNAFDCGVCNYALAPLISSHQDRSLSLSLSCIGRSVHAQGR